jgi:hypothetical protein
VACWWLWLQGEWQTFLNDVGGGHSLRFTRAEAERFHASLTGDGRESMSLEQFQTGMVKIQAAAGVVAFEGTEDEIAAATRIAAMQRGKQTRKNLAGTTGAVEEEDAMFEGTEDEIAAATRIAAMQRGKQTRKNLAGTTGAVEEEDAMFEGTEDEIAAATRIAAVQRGKQARRALTRDEIKAALAEEDEAADEGQEEGAAEEEAEADDEDADEEEA